jgi:uroporphyrinogen-III synthase
MTRPSKSPDRRLEEVQVVVTRAEGVDGPLTRLLSRHGARVLHWAVVAIEPPDDPASLEEGLDRLSSYDWIVFTSPRAVAAVQERRPQAPAGVRVAAVGAATARQLRSTGWPVDIEPAAAGGVGLVEEFRRFGCDGLRVFFPASSIARETVSKELTARGATVDQVVAYQTVPGSLDAAQCLAAIDTGGATVVTFASPSAVEGLESALGRAGFERLMAACPAVVIGRTTERALNRAGFPAAAAAQPSTLEGLSDAVALALNGKET